VSSYLPAVVPATPESAVLPAGMVAVPAAGLSAVPSGAAPAAGTLMVFCHPVVTAPAVVRRDGGVLAGGWLPDFVRLGELERHLGEGVIAAVAAKAAERGLVRVPQRKRIMSGPLTIRLVLAMSLMPDASYCEALARLAGLVARVPFARLWHVPTEKVVTDWRRGVAPSVLEELFWAAAGPLVSNDGPGAVLLAGMPVNGADGMLVAVADTPANRKAFGCAGTCAQHGAGAAPLPHLKIVAVTARAGRAMLGAICGRARTGEQALLARLVRRHPELFAGQVTCFDRNFPGHALITSIRYAGGHVVARIKAGISLPDTGHWLPDGSRLSYLNAPSGREDERIPVRVAEHNAVLPCGDGEDVSETCTLATTILDHQAAPAGAVRDAYLARWSASETTFGEDKTTITGAGDRTSGPVLRSGEPRLAIQEAWAWLTATQLVRASAVASLNSQAAAARALRRRDDTPAITADQISFTAVRHHAIRSMTWSSVTSSTPTAALRATAEDAALSALRTLVTTGRNRHSPREQKHRPRFPHTAATKTTVTGIPEVTVFAPRQALAPRPGRTPGRKGGPPRAAGPRPVEPRAPPAASRGTQACPQPASRTAETDPELKRDTKSTHPIQARTPKVPGVGGRRGAPDVKSAPELGQ
jgi:hypothetical protein